MNFASWSAVRWLRESPEISRKKNETVSRRKKRILASLGSVFCAIFVKIYCFFLAIYVVFIHFSPPQAKKKCLVVWFSFFFRKFSYQRKFEPLYPRVSNLPQGGIVANPQSQNHSKQCFLVFGNQKNRPLPPLKNQKNTSGAILAK